MERRSVATLILTTVCFAACDSGSKPPEKQREAAEQPPSPAPETKQPPPSSGGENKQPPSSGSVTKPPPPSSGTTGKQPPRATPPAPPTRPEQPGAGRGEAAGRSFSIYALSRGSGVPPAAREAQQKVQALVESDRSKGVEVNVQATRLGLEGERKLCVTYANAQDAARALEQVRAMVQGVDLVNVVVEPCGPPPSASPLKEKPQ